MRETTNFDILFRNLFDTGSDFNTLSGAKTPHPVDIYEHSEGLTFEVACTGLSKSEIDIDIEQDVLRISHTKAKQDEQLQRTYQTKGIARRSFNLAYKIASKFNVAKSTATMDNGLLIITMPFAEEAKPKKLEIK